MIPDEIEAPSAETPVEDGRRSRRRSIEWVVVVVVALLAALIIHTYVFQVFRIPSGSMLPTLQINDRIVVDKCPASRTPSIEATSSYFTRFLQTPTTRFPSWLRE